MVIGLKTPFFSYVFLVCYGTDELFMGQFVIRQFNTPTILKLHLKSTNHIHFDVGQCQSDITHVRLLCVF